MDNEFEQECKRCTAQFIETACTKSALTRTLTFVFSTIIFGLSREDFDKMNEKCRNCVKPHKKVLLAKYGTLKWFHSFVDPTYDKLIRKYGD